MKENVSKRTVPFGVLLMLFMALFGCGEKKENVHGRAENARGGEVPIYARETIRVPMAEDFNPYVMDFSEDGIFYFVPKGEGEQEYEFYFQPYDDEENASCFFRKKGGFVRDLSAVKGSDGLHFYLLWREEQAHILKVDPMGNLCGEVKLPEEFVAPGKFPVLCALPEGGCLIGMDDGIWLVQEDGGAGQNANRKDGMVERTLLCRF